MIVPIVHLIRQFGGNLRNLTTNFFHIKIKLNYLQIKPLDLYMDLYMDFYAFFKYRGLSILRRPFFK